MIKKDLIERVAEDTGLSKVKAQEVVNSVLTNIGSALCCDKEKVQLVGFGTFSITQRAERQGTNPRTGEAITISASKSVSFKPSKYLKDELNA